MPEQRFEQSTPAQKQPVRGTMLRAVNNGVFSQNRSIAAVSAFMMCRGRYLRDSECQDGAYPVWTGAASCREGVAEP